MLDLLTKQTEAIQLMANNLSQSKPETSANISWPSPLNIEGNMVTNFNNFIKNWDIYCKASSIDKWGVEHEKKKVNIFLSALGSAAINKYGGFSLT